MQRPMVPTHPIAHSDLKHVGKEFLPNLLVLGVPTHPIAHSDLKLLLTGGCEDRDGLVPTHPIAHSDLKP